MARRKSEYDTACYYGGELMGVLTVADSEIYGKLIEACGGSAIRVLDEYDHFSPELQIVFEKMAAAQEILEQVVPGGVTNLFTLPKRSPWGEIDACDMLCPGVFMVSAPENGGIMVSKAVAAFLSPAAMKCGFKDGGFICFEQETQENVVLRELLDKRLWAVPDRIKNQVAFEENINSDIRIYNPEYWQARQSGMKREAARPDPVRIGKQYDER